MSKAKKQVNWTPIIITALILAFVLIIIFSFNSNNSYRDAQNYENSYTNNKAIESVVISGIGGSRTINYPDKKIKLIISGEDNLITVTKYTEVSEIIVSGIDNQINLCKETHSPKLTDSGIRNKVTYLDC